MTPVRYFTAVLFATAAVFSGCEDQAPEPIHQPNAASNGNQAPPDCDRIKVASEEYGTEIAPTSGPPGTEVTLSGTTLRNENGEWAPSDRLEAWWDTDVPKDGIKLAEVDDMERCHFETTFRVPDDQPGRYKISVFSWEADPREGYGLDLPHYFTVRGE